jgi:hypothetical protein
LFAIAACQLVQLQSKKYNVRFSKCIDKFAATVEHKHRLSVATSAAAAAKA